MRASSSIPSNPNHPAIVAENETAPVRIELSEKPDASYTPAQADADNLSLLRGTQLSYVTLTDHTIEVEVPTVDPSEPVKEVTVGVADDTSADVLKEQVNELVAAVQQQGSGAALQNVESIDSTPVAEKIEQAIQENKAISTQVIVTPVEESSLSSTDKNLVAAKEGDDNIAQYLDCLLYTSPRPRYAH